MEDFLDGILKGIYSILLAGIIMVTGWYVYDTHKKVVEIHKVLIDKL